VSVFRTLLRSIVHRVQHVSVFSRGADMFSLPVYVGRTPKSRRQVKVDPPEFDWSDPALLQRFDYPTYLRAPVTRLRSHRELPAFLRKQAQ